MQILEKDIIVKKTEGRQVIWLHTELVSHWLKLSQLYLRKARSVYKDTVPACHHSKTWLPATGAAWRWGKSNGEIYFCLSDIPNKAPNNYRDQLPTIDELLHLKLTATGSSNTATPFNTFITSYISTHKAGYNKYYLHYTDKQQAQLSAAAAGLAGTAAYIQQCGIKANNLSFYQCAAADLQQAGATYLPAYYRNLKARVQGLLAGQKITDLVYLKREANSNALTHGADADVEAWVYDLRSSGCNYTNTYIARKVGIMCSLFGKAEPSQRWFTQLMETPLCEWITGPTRYGSKSRHGDRVKAHVTLKKALHAGDCWQVDGTRVNFIDFKLNGKEVFLYIVAVRDVYSGDILGYSFDVTENRWCVHAAIKMAVESTGYLPWELVMDKFPGHNTTEMETLFADMNKRGCRTTFTSNPNGKAAIERWFSTLQQVFMMGSDYYYGEGIRSRHQFGHRSYQQIKAMKLAAKNDGWDYDKAEAEACKVVEAYRTTKLSSYSRRYKMIENSPEGLHQQSEKPNVTLLDANQVIYLFALKTKRKFTGEGLLNIQIQNYAFSYRCADANVVANHKEVTICYDLQDLDVVHLYAINDKALKPYLGTAHESSVQVYGPNAEWGKYQRQQAIIINMQQQREQLLDMKLAAGSEFTLMQGGDMDKRSYEQAETGEMYAAGIIPEVDSLDGLVDIRDSY